tara:strand:+ start:80 stop:334 length:255 start_codon:yes stop_codon:yes gene_type:complete
MKSFKKYIDEEPTRRFDPKDRKRSKDVGDDKQVDFDDPAYQHGFNKALRDSEKWPPKPDAKYKADQIRWAVSVGKRPEHLSKEQ